MRGVSFLSVLVFIVSCSDPETQVVSSPKENTKEEYQPENSSFESFKNNKKKKTEYLDGTDLALFARTLD